ncbi:hypothetical protein MNBD_NITROSPINAE01-211, partial [hydrothermal vent metagenome]
MSNKRTAEERLSEKAKKVTPSSASGIAREKSPTHAPVTIIGKYHNTHTPHPLHILAKILGLIFVTETIIMMFLSSFTMPGTPFTWVADA